VVVVIPNFFTSSRGYDCNPQTLNPNPQSLQQVQKTALKKLFAKGALTKEDFKAISVGACDEVALQVLLQGYLTYKKTHPPMTLP